jgi:predicted TIM-barrel fold metal-dependent hydrolase
MKDELVIDADGHVNESAPELRELLEPRWRRENLFPQDYWDREIRGKLGANPKGPQDQLAACDADGIDIMVMYPTWYLCLATIREIDFASAATRAYNTWMHRFCQTNPARLKYVALIAPQDVTAAAQELRRAVEELSAVGAMLPTHVPLRPDWGHRHYDPIYAEAQRLDVGLGFHATLHESLGSHRFNNLINVHTIAHPVEQWMALCGTVIGGVFERFPRLRIGYLESGCGWVPYLMDRLDEEVELRGHEDAPYLTKLPSEYIKSGRIFFGVECGEKTIPDAVRWGLEDTILYSSDYPHWDSDWPHTVREMRERQDLSDVVKRKALHDNAIRFYGPRLMARADSRTKAVAGTA